MAKSSMKYACRVVIAVFVTFIFLPSVLFAASRGIRIISKGGDDLFLYQDYQALVVGISDYEKWPDLPYAVSDAREVAGALEALGFQVTMILNPTSAELKTALSTMTYRMGREKNRAVLFYYAGHGATETMADGTKMGYIIPRDCPVLGKDPIGFVTHAVSMQDIESISLRMRAKHVLMLFDSCFSGALFALVRAVPHDITEKSTLPVRQYITAGREDEAVPDRSMFKRCFLIGLNGHADMTGDGYITGSEMGMYLADNVVNYTKRQQHPQYGKINNPDLDQGDFIFIPKKTLEKYEKQKEVMAERKDLVTDIEN
ncbi:MAG: caspase family protein [Deltaproteobacteria bacterium]|nr:caspase family protein [Deltaproteobacteria bacterium]